MPFDTYLMLFNHWANWTKRNFKFLSSLINTIYNDTGLVFILNRKLVYIW